MKRTGIYGGSFNPIHEGHVRLAKALAESGLVDEMWLLVSPQNPFKANAQLLDDEKRLQLARLAVADVEGVDVCDREFTLPRPSYMYNTLQALSREHPDREFLLVIGADNWERFPGWYRSEDILSGYRIIIYPRPGYELRDVPEAVTIARTPLLDVSSTEIRRRIASEPDYDGEGLSPSVWQTIKRDGLYALLALLSLLSPISLWAEEEELIKYGNFESWITRSIEESTIVGGKKQTLYEIGPKGTFDGARAYTNQGGSPWGSSNAFAKVSGIVKTNLSVFPDKHGDGQCAKLYTHILKCKALGVVNITVLASGSIFLGSLLEPVTSASDPMSKMNTGIPFTKKPKAVKFDYKYYTPGGERIRESGFGRRQTLSGKDMGKCLCFLQKRWEDADGKIHALRVGTMLQYFTQNTPDWKEGQSFDIHYGDISHESFYKEGMRLMSGSTGYHAVNSKGKNVPIQEEGWAGPDDSPTHIILIFNSSYGEAYSGTIGNTLWVDNVKLVY